MHYARQDLTMKKELFSGLFTMLHFLNCTSKNKSNKSRTKGNCTQTPNYALMKNKCTQLKAIVLQWFFLK